MSRRQSHEAVVVHQSPVGSLRHRRSVHRVALEMSPSGSAQWGMRFDIFPRTTYAEKYRSAFPIAPNQTDSFRGQPDALNVYVATSRRDFDGQQLLRAIADGTFNTKAGIANADLAKITQYTSSLTEWFSRQYSQPGSNAWDPQRF